MLSLSAAACAYSLNAPVVVPHHVAPRSGRPVLAMSRREMGQSAALAAALAATLSTSQGAFAAEPWAYSTLLDKTGSDEVSKVVFAEDGKGAVAFDQEGKDHPVQLFPGGDSELVQVLRQKNVAFAVAPRPTPGAGPSQERAREVGLVRETSGSLDGSAGRHPLASLVGEPRRGAGSAEAWLGNPRKECSRRPVGLQLLA